MKETLITIGIVWGVITLIAIMSPAAAGYCFLLIRFVIAPILSIIILCWILDSIFNIGDDSALEELTSTSYVFDDGSNLKIVLSTNNEELFLQYSENDGPIKVEVFEKMSEVSRFLRDKFGVSLEF